VTANAQNRFGFRAKSLAEHTRVHGQAARNAKPKLQLSMMASQTDSRRVKDHGLTTPASKK